MNHLQQNIITNIKQSLINQYGNAISSVILFGSQAKGKAKIDSDYDFVFILEKDYDWRFEKEIQHFLYDFELKYNIFTDVHLISKKEISNSIKGKDPLFVNAIKNGIYL